MGRNNWFEFKQFRVEQEKSAMKVGTDGVLLGAWSPVNGAYRILDIGTGTGLISLMLAQRSAAMIDAIEIDSLACEEARFNFKKSAWSDRLQVIHIDFGKVDNLFDQSYDLVVSNPPFFVNSLKTANAALALARHNDSLSFEQLLSGSSRLLRNTGRLCVILPFSSYPEFRETARLAGFYLKKRTLVVPKSGKEPKRILMEFSLEVTYPLEDELTLLDLNGNYTEDYKSLTSPFYPAF